MRASFAALFFIDFFVRSKKCRHAKKSTTAFRAISPTPLASVIWHIVLSRQEYTDRPNRVRRRSSPWPFPLCALSIPRPGPGLRLSPRADVSPTQPGALLLSAFGAVGFPAIPRWSGSSKSYKSPCHADRTVFLTTYSGGGTHFSIKSTWKSSGWRPSCLSATLHAFDPVSIPRMEPSVKCRIMPSL